MTDPRLTAPHPDAPTALAGELFGWHACSECRARRAAGFNINRYNNSYNSAVWMIVRDWHRRIYREMLADHITNNGEDHT